MEGKEGVEEGKEDGQTSKQGQKGKSPVKPANRGQSDAVLGQFCFARHGTTNWMGVPEIRGWSSSLLLPGSGATFCPVKPPCFFFFFSSGRRQLQRSDRWFNEPLAGHLSFLSPPPSPPFPPPPLLPPPRSPAGPLGRCVWSCPRAVTASAQSCPPALSRGRKSLCQRGRGVLFFLFTVGIYTPSPPK